MAKTKANPAQQELGDVADAVVVTKLSPEQMDADVVTVTPDGPEGMTAEEASEAILESANAELDSVLAPPDPSEEKALTANPDNPPWDRGERAVATTEQSGGVVERLLEKMMINPNIPIERVERMVALFEKERADMRREMHHAAYAKVQAQFEPVPRRKTVTTAAGKKMYDYGPIEEIVKTIGKKLNQAGFTYYFSEEERPVEYAEDSKGETRQLVKMRRYFFHLSGFGHERVNYVDLPESINIEAGNNRLNAGQKRGNSMSYGRRYAMIAGTGVVFEGEDDEQKMVNEEYAEYIDAIEATTDPADSFETGKRFYNELKEKGDERGAKLVATVEERHTNQLKAAKRASH